MIPINATMFVRELIDYVAAHHGIQYRPTLTYQYLSNQCLNENKVSSTCVKLIACAVTKVAWFERYLNDDEFYVLLPNVGYHRKSFVGLFDRSLNQCYLPENSPYNAYSFIRYLAFVIGFAVCCYQQRSRYALDFASLAITRMIYRRRQLFSDPAAWNLLIMEAEQVNLYNIAHHYANFIPAPAQ